MNRVILIKYGELTTKKGNRNFFINNLYKNIKERLSSLEVVISKDYSRMYIEFFDKDLDLILDKINSIFGIHNYQVAYKIESNESLIKDTVRDLLLEKIGTFKIETKRNDKNFPIKSLDFNRVLGGVVLKSNSNLKVEVHQPDYLVRVEILDKYTYIYMDNDTLLGLGGYPVGTLGKGLLMLSGGIDSPVAGYLTLKRGVKLEAVYFEAIPHTSLEARNKVLTLARKLCRYTNGMKVHVVPFTEIQEAIYKECNPEYMITLLRRMMYRIMERLAYRTRAQIISNGESIGQVASQTLTSMRVINEVTNLPIIRPVACLDKIEIINLAKKIDTYETSILPFEDCCTVFVPKHPVINPKLEECLRNEKLFNYEEMISKAVVETIVIKVTEEEESFKNLL